MNRPHAGQTRQHSIVEQNDMPVGDYRKIATVRSVDEFRETLSDVGAELPCDDEIIYGNDSPLAQPLEVLGRAVGNRWAVQPMEGWDGTKDGRPTEYTNRLWRRYGLSGAKHASVVD